VKAFAKGVKRPRKIMLMVKAGKAVDDFIEQARSRTWSRATSSSTAATPTSPTRSAARVRRGEGPALHRHRRLRRRGGRAARGPSIMPGGSRGVAAREGDLPGHRRQDRRPDGEPCCDWVGEDGAGHFVKMVHNGIEYGDMQLICEAYHLMKDGLGLSNDEMHEVFAEWNKGELDSYLIEITRDILGYKDEAGSRRRQDPRHRRPEGHRQVDRRQRRSTRACR
jgi:6-phosphogluconate dehydrogenase